MVNKVALIHKNPADTPKFLNVLRCQFTYYQQHSLEYRGGT